MLTNSSQDTACEKPDDADAANKKVDGAGNVKASIDGGKPMSAGDGKRLEESDERIELE